MLDSTQAPPLTSRTSSRQGLDASPRAPMPVSCRGGGDRTSRRFRCCSGAGRGMPSPEALPDTARDGPDLRVDRHVSASGEYLSSGVDFQGREDLTELPCVCRQTVGKRLHGDFSTKRTPSTGCVHACSRDLELSDSPEDSIARC